MLNTLLDRQGAETVFCRVEYQAQGRAFSERQGFSATGVWRATTIGNKYVKIHRLVKQL